MVDIALSVKLYTSASTFIDLNASPYRIADGSFAQQSVQHRRKTASSPFLEGEYVISSLRQNVTEQFSVYVSGASQYATQTAVVALQNALEQTQFSIVKTVNNLQVTWSCYASDYTMQSNRALTNANLVQIQIQLIRDPIETIVSV
jgi:hypothetical protein